MNLTSEIPLFHNIGQNGIEQMLRCSGARIKEFKEEQAIFSEEDAPTYLYILLKGKVMITKTHPSGRRSLFFEIRENEIFGGLFPNRSEESNWYDAIAAVKCEVLAMPWKFLFNICHNSCEHHRILLRNLLELQTQKSLFLMRKLHVLSAGTLEEKNSLVFIGNGRSVGMRKCGYETRRNGRVFRCNETVIFSFSYETPERRDNSSEKEANFD